jgi:peptidoglycan hydrolase-like protein with peptidoglycan-binding domain
MKRLPWVVLCLFLLLSVVGIAQNSNSSTSTSKNTNASKTKNANANRGPVFRATKDQINQAQALLKQRSFYSGESTGKLDDATRAGLKQYQQAEGLKVTGTLNKVTLEKMGITLTDKQKTM